METKSKLLDIYKKSPFSKIGNKVSAIQTSKILNNIKVKNYNIKSVLEIKKDFDEIVVKPYSTILSELSKIGNIKVNPTISVLNLFDKLNNNISKINISNKTSLINISSNYSNIKQPKNYDLLKYSNISNLNKPEKLSLLNKNLPDIKINISKDKLLNFPIADIKKLKNVNILNLNSSFDDIIEFKTDSILNKKIPFEVVTNFPYSDVLKLDSKFDDLVLQDITSVVKLYTASKLYDIIPTPMKDTPLKKTVETILMPNTPEKPIANIISMSDTPEKPIVNILRIPDTPEKPIVTIVNMPDTPEKSIININLPRLTPDKTIKQLGIVNYIPDIHAYGFTNNALPLVTQFKLGNLTSDNNDSIFLIGNVPSDNAKIGSVNYFDDIYNTGFTINAKSKLTEFKLPTKFSDKINIYSVNNNDNVIDVENQSSIILQNPPYTEYAKGFIANSQQLITNFKLDNIYSAYNNDNVIDVYNKSSIILQNPPYTEYVKGFTVNAQKLITNFKLDNIYSAYENDNIIDVYQKSFIILKSPPNAEYSKGFTVNAKKYITDFRIKDNLIDNTRDEKDIYSVSDTDSISQIYAFNWNEPPGYPGVLNQYAIYFSKYPKLRNVTYKTVIDWAYNRLIRVPEAQELFNKGFHTPLVPVNEFKLIIPPYKYANDRLPIWANTYLSTLEEVGSTLVSGFLSSKSLELIANYFGINYEFQNRNVVPDGNPLLQSQLVFQQLAGEIYWEKNKLGTIIRNVREGTINKISGLIGYTLANNFISNIENTIGGATADLVNSIVDANILDSDKVLMMYHILMGTKYTKSKAFFDRLAKTYSSKYGQIGDNAVNLYNDKTRYEKYLSGDSLDAIAYKSSPALEPIAEKVSSILNNNTSDIAAKLVSEQNNSISRLYSLFHKIVSGSDKIIIPLGDYNDPGLINKYLLKENSSTFGQKIEPQYKSIDKNYPTSKQIDENPSLKVKTDLNALSNRNISDYTNILSNDLYISKNMQPTQGQDKENKNTYYELLKNRLEKQGKFILLEHRGFPSVKTQFSDDKNRLNLIKMSSDDTNNLGIQEYKDNDLIDFYFEDISTLSDTSESIIIPFRAIITSITDGTSANWTSHDYVGRPDKFWIYQGFERRVSVAFDVAINSKDEFISTWRKINYLHGMCYPVEYPAEISMKPPIMALTIGDLFNRIQVILNSFNVNFDGNTIWEIEQGYQLPMYIKIQTDFTVLFDDVILSWKKHYAQQNEWINPNIYDYNETNLQNYTDQNYLTKNKSGKTVLIKNKLKKNVKNDLTQKTYNI